MCVCVCCEEGSYRTDCSDVPRIFEMVAISNLQFHSFIAYSCGQRGSYFVGTDQCGHIPVQTVD